MDPFYQRKGNRIGMIYRLSHEDVKRMDGKRGELGFIRLKPGFPCLCIKHTGDAFNNYVILNCVENGIKAIPQSEFGAYHREIQSKPLRWFPSEKEFHLLLAGEWISVDPNEIHPLTKELQTSGYKSDIKTTIIGGTRINV